MAVTTAAGVAVVAWGAWRMKEFVKDEPLRKPLLGMLGAFIFWVSLIPLPAFTGTTSHPCGTPLAGILFGPGIAAALSFLALLLQASFFAHGGFSSLGANTLTLGLVGAGSAWLTYRAGRALGLPLWAAAGLAGLLGDVLTYVAAGGLLGTHLAFFAPEPKYSFSGYLAAIYAAYLPTQLPIAFGEMLVTGFAMHSIARMRPEVLENLGVENKGGPKNKRGRALLGLLGLMLLSSPLSAAPPAAVPASASSTAAAPSFPGMDEAVNERIAHEAGAHARDPYINLEAMGDVWNFVLLLGGGVAGFVMGYNFRVVFGAAVSGKKKRRKK